jgi:hypothetical protein
MAAHEVLEDDLVHGHRTGQHAGPDVRDAGQLEEALERAVLTIRTVDHQEGHVDGVGQRVNGGPSGKRSLVDRHGRQVLVAAELLDLLVRGRRAQQAGQSPTLRQLRRWTGWQQPVSGAVDVHHVRLVPIAVDGAQHGLGRRDADLVLRRPATGEDPDPQPPSLAHAGTVDQSPTNSISYASSTPNRSLTVARTRSPSARTSAARPDLRSVTMKLACS